MVICYLYALKKSAKKRETGIEKKIAKILQQAADCRKKTGNYKIGMMKFLALTVHLLTLISRFTVIDCV